MKSILTLLVVAVLPLTSAEAPLPQQTVAEGTADGACYKMWWCSGGHYMYDGPSGPYANYHSDCSQCLYGNCHPGCSPVDAGKKEDYLRMVAAAEHLDVGGVLDAAKAIPEFAFYNVQRASVQVLSCDKGTVIASIPVEGALRHVAATQLSRQPTRLVADATD